MRWKNVTEKNPKISIITPSYNQARFIEKTIQSILSQDYPNLEYIVVDGESTDGTCRILKQYKGKLTWTSERDKGQTNAINKGLKRASGDILAYLNSDDLYLPGTLHKVTDYFMKHEDIYWVTGRCKIIDENDREVRNLISTWKNFWLQNRFFAKYRNMILFILNFISQPSTFWRREVLDRIGYFDEALLLSMDYDYWIRLVKEYKLGIIDDDLSAYRVHIGSKSAKEYRLQFKEGYEISKKHTDSFILPKLHKLHDTLITNIYEQILKI